MQFKKNQNMSEVAIGRGGGGGLETSALNDLLMTIINVQHNLADKSTRVNK